MYSGVESYKAETNNRPVGLYTRIFAFRTLDFNNPVKENNQNIKGWGRIEMR